MSRNKTPQYLKLDQCNHGEKPLLDQLDGLKWEIIDLDSNLLPGDSYRQSITEVVMLPVLGSRSRPSTTGWLIRNGRNGLRDGTAGHVG